MKKLLFILSVCSSSLLHTAGSRDLVNFRNAVQVWQKSNSYADMERALELFEILKNDTRYPGWAQQARSIASNAGIQNIDAQLENLYEPEEEIEETIEMEPIAASPMRSISTTTPATMVSSASMPMTPPTPPAISRRPSIDMENKYDTAESKITPSAHEMETEETVTVAPEIQAIELEENVPSTEEKAIIVEEILKQEQNHAVREKALAFEAASSEFEQILNVLRNLDIRDPKTVAEHGALLERLDELMQFIKSEDNSVFYMDSAHKNSCNINEAKHLLKRARKTHAYVPQAPALDARKVFAPYSHDLKERLEEIRRLTQAARGGIEGKKWFITQGAIEGNVERAEKDLKAIQHILYEEDLESLVQEIGDLKTYLATKKLKDAYNALLKIYDNHNIKRVAPLTQKEKDTYILAYDKLGALLNMRAGSLDEKEYNRFNVDLAQRYNQYKYGPVQSARSILGIGKGPNKFAQKAAPTPQKIKELKELQNKSHELKFMMTTKAAIDVDAEYLQLVSELETLKNTFSVHDATMKAIQDDLDYIQKLNMKRLKAKLVEQGIIPADKNAV